jgi:hypothetical protein
MLKILKTLVHWLEEKKPLTLPTCDGILLDAGLKTQVADRKTPFLAS